MLTAASEPTRDAAADAPAAEPEAPAPAPTDAPVMVSGAPSATASPRRLLDPWARPSSNVFPRPSLLQFLEVTFKSMAGPTQVHPGEEWVLAALFAGVPLAVATDIATHRAINVLPDPQIAPGFTLAQGVTLLGDGWVNFAIFAALWVVGGRDAQRAGMAGIAAMAAVAVVSRVGKLIFRLERPSYDPNRQHWFSDRWLQADAMPSGHTMSAFATAAVLAMEYPKAKWLFYALATWVGLTRVQLSTHWVSDTLVGAVVGLFIGWEAWRLTRAFELAVQPWAGPDGGGLSVSSRF